MNLRKRVINIKNLRVIFSLFITVTISTSISFIVDAKSDINTGIETDSRTLQHNGFADIIFGEKLRATSLKFKQNSSEIEGCQYVKIAAYPDLHIMVVDGIITRLDTRNIGLIKADSPFYGLATGTMTLSSFKLLYPKIEITPHEYENGFYLRWYNQDESKAIVVDYVDGQISLLKAGLVPSVLFVEGCA